MRRQNAASRKIVGLAIILTLSALVASAEEGPAFSKANDLLADGKGFENVVDPALEYFKSRQFKKVINAPAGDFEKSLGQVITLEHNIPLGGGRFMRVQEQFTLRSWLRWPHRAILMMSSSAFNRKTFSIPVEGYNGTEMFAQRGFFVFTVDYIGIGDSFKPEDGWDANRDVIIPAVRRLLPYIRFFRLVPKVDILAEGYGATMAPSLAADSRRVRSLLMSSTVYKILGPFGPGTNPFFNEFVLNDEDGYIPIAGQDYLPFLLGAPAEVVDFHYETQAGEYPAPLFGVTDVLPIFDPGVARVPGLIIAGARDLVADPQDPFELAADYGTDGAEVIVLEEAGHAPRVETPETAARYWAEVINFFDP